MSTFHVEFHRVLRAPPERVYAAFLSPAAMAKWLPPHGFVGEVQQMDAQVGGHWHMRFINLANGASHGFGGKYLELLPGRRLRYDARFDEGLPGTLLTTVTLEPVFCGTAMKVLQEGIPAEIPAAACQLGWQESLQLLALLVEAEVSG